MSFVFAVRDPGYAGGLLERARRFLDGLFGLLGRLGLPAEVVLVEWNPPPDRPRFREALAPRALPPATSLRVIEVPPSVHARLPNAERMPFFQMTGRNVGIRRARAPWIVATSADAFYSEELVAWLARSPLRRRSFYLTDRWDLLEPIPAELDLDGRLAFCRHTATIRHTRAGSLWLRGTAVGSERLRDRLRLVRLEVAYRAVRVGCNAVALAERLAPDLLVVPADGLHRNGSGEFVLMHREDWHALRGYPELETFGHLDSILCWKAASAGLRQRLLPSRCRVYHQPHGRARHRELPATDWRSWYARYRECRRRGVRLEPGSDRWGLADEDLPQWEWSGAAR